MYFFFNEAFMKWLDLKSLLYNVYLLLSFSTIATPLQNGGRDDTPIYDSEGEIHDKTTADFLNKIKTCFFWLHLPTVTE